MCEFEQLNNKAYGFFDGKSEKNNVVNFIKHHADQNPEGIAFCWVDQSKPIVWGNSVVTEMQQQKITFGAFYDLICHTAQGLREAGLEHGNRVIIFLPMSLPLYQTMAAVQMIGASAVFLDSWARRDQLGVSARIAGAKSMISFEQAFALCTGEPDLAAIPIKIVVGPHKGVYSTSLDKLVAAKPFTTVEAVEGNETALITFTTGSSGSPKGANRTHQFLAAQHYALNKCIPYTDKDVDLPAFPIFSLNNLAAGVKTAIPVIDIGRPSEKDPMMLVSQMLSFGITSATLSPAMVVGVAKFCHEYKTTMPNVRRVITGGAPISNETLALMKKAVPKSEVWVLYGSTEVEPIAHIEANDILHPKQGLGNGEGVNVGHFAEGLEVKFIKIRKTSIRLENNDWGQLEVSPGSVGEIVVSGLHVCKSYFNDPGAVAKTKIIEANGKVWHRTGDLGNLDSQGNLWLVGRVHNAIARKDEMLFPVKVEMLLKRHPDVKQAAFVGLPDPDLGEKAYALVELKDMAADRSEAILRELEGQLRDAKIPCDFLGKIENIPMDPRHHSKVEYGLLRDRLLAKK